MTDSEHIFLTMGSLYGFLSVAAGAFGAHLLKSKLSLEHLNIFEVAVRYQMYHALALIGLTALLHLFPNNSFIVAGWLFIFGTFIFCGSIYALVFSGIRSWGAITPIGGLLLLIGWLTIFVGGF